VTAEEETIRDLRNIIDGRDSVIKSQRRVIVFLMDKLEQLALDHDLEEQVEKIFGEINE